MSDLADAIAFVGRWRPKESDARALAVVVAAARERLRLSRDEDGLWPAELVEVVREQLESGDGDDARAVLTAIDAYLSGSRGGP